MWGNPTRAKSVEKYLETMKIYWQKKKKGGKIYRKILPTRAKSIKKYLEKTKVYWKKNWEKINIDTINWEKLFDTSAEHK